jgi:hypothetical protein
MQRFGWLFLVASAAVTACGSSGSGGGSSQPATQGGVQLLGGFEPGPAPDTSKGFQVITPIVDNIEPGGSYEYCTWTNIILDHDVWIDETQSIQSETGHHVVAYYSMVHNAPGTHLCQAAEMADFRYGVASGGGNIGTLNTVTFPGNLAAKLPAGAQIVVNHHYLNASAKNVSQAQSAVNVLYADPTKPHTPTNVMSVLDSSLTVPTGASTYKVDCTIDQKYSAYLEIPHAHNMATHVLVTNTPAAGGEPKTLFNMDWNPDFAFNQSIATEQPLSAPMDFMPGDKIHMECDFLNTSGMTATFGTEMCLFVAFTINPVNGEGRQCDRGEWGNF